MNGDAVGNQLIVRDGTVSAGGFIAGGYSEYGSAKGNTVTIENASLSRGMASLKVTGGRALKDATENSVIVNGGEIDAEVIGGESKSDGNPFFFRHRRHLRKWKRHGKYG